MSAVLERISALRELCGESPGRNERVWLGLSRFDRQAVLHAAGLDRCAWARPWLLFSVRERQLIAGQCRGMEAGDE